MQILKDKLAMMEKYLKLKTKERDWHGVADAAMDIREIEAQLKILKELVDLQPKQS
jgi:hypothetical protein